MPSTVWDTFTKKGDEKVECKICKKSLSYKGSNTSGMKRHLASVHKIHDSDKGAGPSRQAAITGYTKPTVCRESKANQISSLIGEMIAIDSLPISIVEKDGFVKLMEFLEPAYKISPRKTMTKIIENIYNKKKENLKDTLSTVSDVALTTDCWTSLTMEGYMTVTAHYVQDGKLQPNVLDTSPMEKLPEEDGTVTEGPQRHTAEALAGQLAKVTNNWDITNKVCAVVHDNASNTKHISDKANFESSCDVPCAAHTLQLAIKKGMAIPRVANLVGAANRLVTHFKKSTVATKALETKQEGQKLKKHRLITACPTRWNSAYDMMERLLENRWAICAVLGDRTYTRLQDAKTFDLKEENWDLMTDLVKCLKPRKVGQILYYSIEVYYSTISEVSLLVLGILMFLFCQGFLLLSYFK